MESKRWTRGLCFVYFSPINFFADHFSVTRISCVAE